jgi:hypothetical protein
LSTEGKRFHLGAEFPAIGAFIAAFPQAINVRVNGLGTNSGLSPHEEHPLRYRTDRDCWLTARFHLPIMTNPGAEALLDGDLFRLETGSVFLFNNGCIHSARNSGCDTRYHLVWDMLLTREAYELMFDKESGLPSFLRRTNKDERIVQPHRRKHVREYQTYGPGPELHQKWKLHSFGIPVYRFQNWYTRWRYLRYLCRESVNFYRI